MLLKQALIDRIVAGEVTVVYRRFVRPTVKTGGTLTTRGGVLAIGEVAPAAVSKLTKADATAAGFATLKALKDDIAGQRQAPLYRVMLSPGGEDPRAALRQTKLSAKEADALIARLDGWDATSKHGPWAWPSLTWIKEHPGRRAQDWADTLGVEKKWIKANIRRLKAHGLTESLEVGYRLSPRGKALMRRRARR
jgi:DNA-binding MarR family transcriptional regulator